MGVVAEVRQRQGISQYRPTFALAWLPDSTAPRG